MTEKNYSIKDVAKEANVSISTVSYVINDTRFVSKERKKRVLKAIKKLHYVPNKIARGLRIKSLKAVGVLVPDIANPFFAQVIRGMEEIARKRGFTLILGCTSYDLEEEEHQIKLLVNQFIDGLIFFCGYDSFEHIKKVYNNNIPVVVVDREIGHKEIPSVLVNNALAMESAVDYLVKLGHREIGYISFSFDNQTTVRKRYEGYCNGLSKNNIPFNPDISIINDSIRLNETIGTYNIIKKLLKRKEVPTSFVTLADGVAIGLIQSLKELGYKIPNDISVVGFNNEVISRFSDPPLTTVKQPKKLMGKTAMSLLIDIIEGKEIKNKNIVLPTEVIVRGSTRTLLT